MQKRKDLVLAKKVGIALGKAIKASGQTRYRIAGASGISQSSLSRFLDGASLPSLATFTKLCKAVKVTPNDLLL